MLIVSRRSLLVGAAASSLVGVLPARSAEPVLTPRQTEGPFYPSDWSGDIDNDLVLVKGEAAQAIGKVTHVSGRILTPSGAPLPGATVEIWQCDSNGRYLHSGDRGSFFNRESRDKGFQGRGRMTTGEDGVYRFRTIKPVAYPGRTPHIHFRVNGAEGELLTTQMYVADEAGNESDGLYTSIRDDRARASVTVRLEPANGIEEGALAGTFDIVVA
jgi:protocatechuate 3,4-dioxygenase beta subunit